jgi:hypothetical protein
MDLVDMGLRFGAHFNSFVLPREPSPLRNLDSCFRSNTGGGSY